MTPASRADIMSAVDGYQEASARKDASLARLDKSATRRDNGHAAGDLAQSPMATHTSVRGRRSLIVDASQGLALELILRDNAATDFKAPAEFLAPWSDLRAQLFKVEGGRITHVEELVRRVPFGRESEWGPPTVPA